MARLILLVAVVSIFGCSGDSAEPQATVIGDDETAEPVACWENADCGDEALYCAKEPGDCDGEGECRERPELCTADYRPVCGCDGQTYGNACNAAAAGQSVAYEGECEEDSSG